MDQEQVRGEADHGGCRDERNDLVKKAVQEANHQALGFQEFNIDQDPDDSDEKMLTDKTSSISSDSNPFTSAMEVKTGVKKAVVPKLQLDKLIKKEESKMSKGSYLNLDKQYKSDQESCDHEHEITVQDIEVHPSSTRNHEDQAQHLSLGCKEYRIEEMSLFVTEPDTFAIGERINWKILNLKSLEQIAEDHNQDTDNMSVSESESFRHTEYMSVINMHKTMVDESKQDCHMLTPETKIYFYYKTYSVVILLDYSPSMISIDLKKSQLNFKKIQSTLELILNNLTPCDTQTGRIIFKPSVRVTIVAYGIIKNSFKIVLHNYPLEQQKMNRLLKRVKQKLKNIECYCKQLIDSSYQFSSCLEYVLQNAIFLHISGEKDAKRIIINISDSSATVSKHHVYNNIGMQLGRDDTNYIHISLVANNEYKCPLGYVNDHESIQNLCNVTGGAYIELDQLVKWSQEQKQRQVFDEGEEEVHPFQTARMKKTKRHVVKKVQKMKVSQIFNKNFMKGDEPSPPTITVQVSQEESKVDKKEEGEVMALYHPWLEDEFNSKLRQLNTFQKVIFCVPLIYDEADYLKRIANLQDKMRRMKHEQLMSETPLNLFTSAMNTKFRIISFCDYKMKSKFINIAEARTRESFQVKKISKHTNLTGEFIYYWQHNLVILYTVIEWAKRGVSKVKISIVGSEEIIYKLRKDRLQWLKKQNEIKQFKRRQMLKKSKQNKLEARKALREFQRYQKESIFEENIFQTVCDFIEQVHQTDSIVEQLNVLNRACQREICLQKYFYDDEPTFFEIKKERTAVLKNIDYDNTGTSSYLDIEEVQKINQDIIPKLTTDPVKFKGGYSKINQFKYRNKTLLKHLQRNLNICNWHSYFQIERFDLIGQTEKIDGGIKLQNPLNYQRVTDENLNIRREVFKEIYDYSSLIMSQSQFLKVIHNDIPTQEKKQIKLKLQKQIAKKQVMEMVDQWKQRHSDRLEQCHGWYRAKKAWAVGWQKRWNQFIDKDVYSAEFKDRYSFGKKPQVIQIDPLEKTPSFNKIKSEPAKQKNNPMKKMSGVQKRNIFKQSKKNIHSVVVNLDAEHSAGSMGGSMLEAINEDKEGHHSSKSVNKSKPLNLFGDDEEKAAQLKDMVDKLTLKSDKLSEMEYMIELREAYQDQIGLCFINVEWVAPNLATIYLGFFNLDLQVRQKTLKEIKDFFKEKDYFNISQDQYKVTDYRKPYLDVLDKRVTSILVHYPRECMSRNQVKFIRKQWSNIYQKNLSAIYNSTPAKQNLSKHASINFKSNPQSRRPSNDASVKKKLTRQRKRLIMLYSKFAPLLNNRFQESLKYLTFNPSMSILNFIPYNRVRKDYNFTQKWIWHTPNLKVVQDFLSLLLRQRICEGFTYVNTCDNKYLLIKKIKIYNQDFAHMNVAQKNLEEYEESLIQYLITLQPHSLDKQRSGTVTGLDEGMSIMSELFMEQQSGFIIMQTDKRKKVTRMSMGNVKVLSSYTEKDFYKEMCRYMDQIDHSLFNSTSTYHNLFKNTLTEKLKSTDRQYNIIQDDFPYELPTLQQKDTSDAPSDSTKVDNYALTSLINESELCYFKDAKRSYHNYDHYEMLLYRLRYIQTDLQLFLNQTYVQQHPTSEINLYQIHHPTSFSDHETIKLRRQKQPKDEAIYKHPEFSIDQLLENSETTHYEKDEFKVPEFDMDNPNIDVILEQFQKNFLQIFDKFCDYKLPFNPNYTVYVKIVAKNVLYLVSVPSTVVVRGNNEERKGEEQVKSDPISPRFEVSPEQVEGDNFLSMISFKTCKDMIKINLGKKKLGKMQKYFNPQFQEAWESSRKYFQENEESLNATSTNDQDMFDYELYYDEKELQLESNSDEIIKKFRAYIKGAYDIVYAKTVFQSLQRGLDISHTNFQTAKKQLQCFKFKLSLTDLILVSQQERKRGMEETAGSSDKKQSKLGIFNKLELTEQIDKSKSPSGRKTKRMGSLERKYIPKIPRSPKRNFQSSNNISRLLHSKTFIQDVREFKKVNEDSKNEDEDLNSALQKLIGKSFKEYNKEGIFYYFESQKTEPRKPKAKASSMKDQEIQSEKFDDTLPLLLFSLDAKYQSEEDAPVTKHIRHFSDIFDEKLIKNSVGNVAVLLDYFNKLENKSNKSAGQTVNKPGRLMLNNQFYPNDDQFTPDRSYTRSQRAYSNDSYDQMRQQYQSKYDDKQPEVSLIINFYVLPEEMVTNHEIYTSTDQVQLIKPFNPSFLRVFNEDSIESTDEDVRYQQCISCLGQCESHDDDPIVETYSLNHIKAMIPTLINISESHQSKGKKTNKVIKIQKRMQTEMAQHMHNILQFISKQKLHQLQHIRPLNTQVIHEVTKLLKIVNHNKVRQMTLNIERRFTHILYDEIKKSMILNVGSVSQMEDNFKDNLPKCIHQQNESDEINQDIMHSNIFGTKQPAKKKKVANTHLKGNCHHMKDIFFAISTDNFKNFFTKEDFKQDDLECSINSAHIDTTSLAADFIDAYDQTKFAACIQDQKPFKVPFWLMLQICPQTKAKDVKSNKKQSLRQIQEQMKEYVTVSYTYYLPKHSYYEQDLPILTPETVELELNRVFHKTLMLGRVQKQICMIITNQQKKWLYSKLELQTEDDSIIESVNGVVRRRQDGIPLDQIFKPKRDETQEKQIEEKEMIRKKKKAKLKKKLRRNQEKWQKYVEINQKGLDKDKSETTSVLGDSALGISLTGASTIMDQSVKDVDEIDDQKDDMSSTKQISEVEYNIWDGFILPMVYKYEFEVDNRIDIDTFLGYKQEQSIGQHMIRALSYLQIEDKPYTFIVHKEEEHSFVFKLSQYAPVGGDNKYFIMQTYGINSVREQFLSPLIKAIQEEIARFTLESIQSTILRRVLPKDYQFIQELNNKMVLIFGLPPFINKYHEFINYLKQNLHKIMKYNDFKQQAPIRPATSNSGSLIGRVQPKNDDVSRSMFGQSKKKNPDLKSYETPPQFEISNSASHMSLGPDQFSKLKQNLLSHQSQIVHKEEPSSFVLPYDNMLPYDADMYRLLYSTQASTNKQNTTGQQMPTQPIQSQPKSKVGAPKPGATGSSNVKTLEHIYGKALTLLNIKIINNPHPSTFVERESNENGKSYIYNNLDEMMKDNLNREFKLDQDQSQARVQMNSHIRQNQSFVSLPLVYQNRKEYMISQSPSYVLPKSTQHQNKINQYMQNSPILDSRPRVHSNSTQNQFDKYYLRNESLQLQLPKFFNRYVKIMHKERSFFGSKANSPKAKQRRKRKESEDATFDIRAQKMTTPKKLNSFNKLTPSNSPAKIPRYVDIPSQKRNTVNPDKLMKTNYKKRQFLALDIFVRGKLNEKNYIEFLILRVNQSILEYIIQNVLTTTMKQELLMATLLKDEKSTSRNMKRLNSSQKRIKLVQQPSIEQPIEHVLNKMKSQEKTKTNLADRFPSDKFIIFEGDSYDTNHDKEQKEQKEALQHEFTQFKNSIKLYDSIHYKRNHLKVLSPLLSDMKWKQVLQLDESIELVCSLSKQILHQAAVQCTPKLLHSCNNSSLFVIVSLKHIRYKMDSSQVIFKHKYFRKVNIQRHKQKRRLPDKKSGEGQTKQLYIRVHNQGSLEGIQKQKGLTMDLQVQLLKKVLLANLKPSETVLRNIKPKMTIVLGSQVDGLGSSMTDVAVQLDDNRMYMDLGRFTMLKSISTNSQFSPEFFDQSPMKNRSQQNRTSYFPSFDTLPSLFQSNRLRFIQQGSQNEDYFGQLNKVYSLCCQDDVPQEVAAVLNQSDMLTETPTKRDRQSIMGTTRRFDNECLLKQTNNAVIFNPEKSYPPINIERDFMIKIDISMTFMQVLLKTFNVNDKFKQTLHYILHNQIDWVQRRRSDLMSKQIASAQGTLSQYSTVIPSVGKKNSLFTAKKNLWSTQSNQLSDMSILGRRQGKTLIRTFGINKWSIVQPDIQKILKGKPIRGLVSQSSMLSPSQTKEIREQIISDPNSPDKQKHAKIKEKDETILKMINNEESIAQEDAEGTADNQPKNLVYDISQQSLSRFKSHPFWYGHDTNQYNSIMEYSSAYIYLITQPSTYNLYYSLKHKINLILSSLQINSDSIIGTSQVKTSLNQKTTLSKRKNHTHAKSGQRLNKSNLLDNPFKFSSAQLKDLNHQPVVDTHMKLMNRLQHTNPLLNQIIQNELLKHHKMNYNEMLLDIAAICSREAFLRPVDLEDETSIPKSIFDGIKLQNRELLNQILQYGVLVSNIEAKIFFDQNIFTSNVKNIPALKTSRQEKLLSQYYKILQERFNDKDDKPVVQGKTKFEKQSSNMSEVTEKNKMKSPSRKREASSRRETQKSRVGKRSKITKTQVILINSDEKHIIKTINDNILLIKIKVQNDSIIEQIYFFENVASNFPSLIQSAYFPKLLEMPQQSRQREKDKLLRLMGGYLDRPMLEAFNYDHHLKKIYKFANENPKEINFDKLLKDFVKYYPQAPKYSLGKVNKFEMKEDIRNLNLKNEGTVIQYLSECFKDHRFIGLDENGSRVFMFRTSQQHHEEKNPLVSSFHYYQTKHEKYAKTKMEDDASNLLEESKVEDPMIFSITTVQFTTEYTVPQKNAVKTEKCSTDDRGIRSQLWPEDEQPKGWNRSRLLSYNLDDFEPELHSILLTTYICYLDQSLLTGQFTQGVYSKNRNRSSTVDKITYFPSTQQTQKHLEQVIDSFKKKQELKRAWVNLMELNLDANEFYSVLLHQSQRISLVDFDRRYKNLFNNDAYGNSFIEFLQVHFLERAIKMDNQASSQPLTTNMVLMEKYEVRERRQIRNPDLCNHQFLLNASLSMRKGMRTMQVYLVRNVEKDTEISQPEKDLILEFKKVLHLYINIMLFLGLNE